MGIHWQNTHDKDCLRSCSIHRVFVRPDASGIEIINFVTFSLDIDISGVYIDETDLPDWVTRKLSALHFCSWGDKPTDEIKGVGRRIDENTFWIYS